MLNLGFEFYETATIGVPYFTVPIFCIFIKLELRRQNSAKSDKISSCCMNFLNVESDWEVVIQTCFQHKTTCFVVAKEWECSVEKVIQKQTQWAWGSFTHWGRDFYSDTVERNVYIGGLWDAGGASDYYTYLLWNQTLVEKECCSLNPRAGWDW